MKTNFFSRACFLLLAVPFAAQGAETEWNLTKANLRIPYGQSVYSYQLKAPTNISPFRIYYTPSPTCQQFGVSARVRYEGATTMSNARFENKAFVTDNKKVDVLEILFTQTRYTWQDCQISVQSLAPHLPLPPERVFAGVVDHSGGFVSHKQVMLGGTYLTQDIELVIPDYCQGYEVADLGVVVNNEANPGTVVEADPEGQRAKTLTYHLNKPYPVSQLEISLLAPATLACQIPVYVRPIAQP